MDTIFKSCKTNVQIHLPELEQKIEPTTETQVILHTSIDIYIFSSQFHLRNQKLLVIWTRPFSKCIV